MLKAIHDTILKSHPVDSQGNVPNNFQSISFPKNSIIQETDFNWVRPALNNHWIIELKVAKLGRFNWYVFRDHVEIIESKSAKVANLPIDWKNPDQKISKYFLLN